LHAQAVTLQGQVQADIIKLNKYLDNLRDLVVHNQTLLYLRAVTVGSDLEVDSFTTEIEALPSPPAGIMPFEIIEVTAEGVSATLILKLLWNGAKQSVQSVRSFLVARPVAEGIELGDIEAGVLEDLFYTGVSARSVTVLEQAASQGGEAVAEASIAAAEDVGQAASNAAARAIFGSMSAKSLALTGLGIFVAVGIDAIFGAIEGAKEAEVLDDLIAKLGVALDKVKDFMREVQSHMKEIRKRTEEQEQIFLDLMEELTTIKTASFQFKYAVGFDNLAKFVAVQKQAISEYSLLVHLRNTYHDALQRNAKVTKDEVIANVLLTAPADVTKELVEEYWNILAKHSDAMKQAKR